MSPQHGQRTHRLTGAHWWVEMDGRVAIRSLGGGAPRLLDLTQIQELAALLAAAHQETTAGDCYAMRVMSHRYVVVPLAPGGRGKQDINARAVLGRQDIDAMLAEQRTHRAAQRGTLR